MGHPHFAGCELGVTSDPQEPAPPVDELDSAAGAPGHCRGSPEHHQACSQGCPAGSLPVPPRCLEAEADPAQSCSRHPGKWDLDQEGRAPGSLERAKVWGLIWALCSGSPGPRSTLGKPHPLWVPVSSVSMITQDPRAKSWASSSAPPQQEPTAAQRGQAPPRPPAHGRDGARHQAAQHLSLPSPAPPLPGRL